MFEISCWFLCLCPSHQFPIKNTWYTASRFVPFFKARGTFRNCKHCIRVTLRKLTSTPFPAMNASGWFHPPLPSLDENDIVFSAVDGEPFQMDWSRQVMVLSTGNRSRMEFGAYPTVTVTDTTAHQWLGVQEVILSVEFVRSSLQSNCCISTCR